MRTLVVSAILHCALLMVTTAWAQDGEIHAVDWGDPASIDVYAEGIGDFLDAESDEVMRELADQGFETYNAGEYEHAIQYYLALAHHGPH